jgi:hypothetical protein
LLRHSDLERRLSVRGTIPQKMRRRRRKIEVRTEIGSRKMELARELK